MVRMPKPLHIYEIFCGISCRDIFLFEIQTTISGYKHLTGNNEVGQSKKSRKLYKNAVVSIKFYPYNISAIRSSSVLNCTLVVVVSS